MMLFEKYGLTFFFYLGNIARTLNGKVYFFECDIIKDGKVVKKGVMCSKSFPKLDEVVCDYIVELHRGNGILDELI